ncbi:hypothetical protein HMPREF0388_1140 [Mobiluncus curtisii ATCC 51333]|uniref:Uncharacterized protein n=1 Tax=Mobiluncus curtisii ATCC 51333 TaxID=887326 RepID=E6LZ53_9ACTO|nr:hypothetical protein HMPREF0388_1140 [Mobiluncus curtisii ATCC 51333]
MFTWSKPNIYLAIRDQGDLRHEEFWALIWIDQLYPVELMLGVLSLQGSFSAIVK